VAAAPHVAAAIAHFISMEVRHMIDAIFRSTPFAAVRHVTFVAVMNIEVVIYVAVEVVRAMKPRACTDEDAVYKPFRAVVAVGSTSIRRVIIVAVRARRFRSN
jgi:hypothetical protein